MEIQGKGDFLLAKSVGEGQRVYGADFGEKGRRDIVLEPLVWKAIEEMWIGNPVLMRDVQNGKVLLCRSDEVPDSQLPGIDEKFALSSSQHALAKRIAYSISPPSEEIVEAISVHKLLGEGGITPAGVKVTKEFCQGDHLKFIRATLDLEKRLQDRAGVKRLFTRLIKEIEAL